MVSLKSLKEKVAFFLIMKNTSFSLYLFREAAKNRSVPFKPDTQHRKFQTSYFKFGKAIGNWKRIL